MRKIAVVVVDDHPVVRQGVRALLSSTDDIEVVGEAADGMEAIEATDAKHPDVVLMDVVMPVLNGIDATRRVKERCPSVGVLMLTTYAEEQYAREALEAGAVGYVLKRTASTDLAAAIRSASKGAPYFDRTLRRKQSDGQPQSLPTPPAITEREEQVWDLVADGLKSDQIAERLGISVRQARRSRRNLMDKLGIHTIAGLTRQRLRSRADKSLAALE